MMRVSLIAVLLSLTLDPCFAAEKGLRVTDSLGRTVVLSRPPKRIISWAPNVTEILFALGLGSRVVGVTSYCDFPAGAGRLPKVGSITAPDMERTLALHPDIVIGSRLNPAALFHSLHDFGIRSFAVDAPEDIGGLFAIIEAIGRITGSSEKATALNRSMRLRIERIRRLTTGLAASRRPSSLLIYQLDPLWTAGSDTFADEAIRIAGGANAAADVRGYSKYSLETVLARAPQVILVTPMNASDAPAARRRVMSYGPFRKLPAVRQGRVYAVNPDWIDRAGPRIILGVEQIARLLHPEIFERPRAR